MINILLSLVLFPFGYQEQSELVPALSELELRDPLPMQRIPVILTGRQQFTVDLLEPRYQPKPSVLTAEPSAIPLQSVLLSSSLVDGKGGLKPFTPVPSQAVASGSGTAMMPRDIQPNLQSATGDIAVSAKSWKMEPFALPKAQSVEPPMAVLLPAEPAPLKRVAAKIETTGRDPMKISKVKEIKKPEEAICSLSGVDMDFAKALKFLTVNTGLNLVLVAQNVPKVTLQLKDVTALELLQHLCALGGVQYLKVGSTYTVAPESTLKTAYPKEWELAHPAVKTPETDTVKPKDEETVEVVRLSNIAAKEVVDLIGKMFKEVSAMAGPSYSTPTLAAQDASATTGQQAQVAQRDSNDGNSRVVILKGPQSLLGRAKQMILALDTPRRQIAIQVEVVDVSNNALKELGIAWTPSGVTFNEKVNNDGLNIGKLTRSALSFTGAVATLEKLDKAKVLASPNLTVMDGEKGFILIGDRINFPLLVGYTQNNAPIFDKQTERVGIYLQVAATVGSDDQVTLTLYPQVSTISGFLTVNGASYPQVSTRELQTSLTVASGQTFVLGGLLRDEEINNREKTPLLGDIPFFGELFTRRKKSKNSSQVIISITPKVIEKQ